MSCVSVVFCCCHNDFKTKGGTPTIRAKCKTLAVEEGLTALLLETIPSLFSKGLCTSLKLHMTPSGNEEGKGHPGEDDSSELACILMVSVGVFFTALITVNFVRQCIFLKWWCDSFSWRSVASSMRYSALLYYSALNWSYRWWWNNIKPPFFSQNSKVNV